MGCPINLVLASSSPRRRQLLTEMGWSSFKTRPAELDETPLMGEKPEEMVLRLAENKALAVGMHYALDTSVWILGADTTVNVGGIILEKPLDRRDAFRMIKLLAGKTHLVHTGIALVSSGAGNRFGHPRPPVVRRWCEAGAEVVDTARAGAIRVWLGAAGLQMQERRPSRPRLWDAARRRNRTAGLCYAPEMQRP